MSSRNTTRSKANEPTEAKWKALRGEWILIIVGAFVAWRVLNGFLNSNSGYTVQSSNYVGPTYPNVGYGSAGPQFGIVGANWPTPGSYGGSGYYGGRVRSRIGRPNGSARW